MIKPIKHRLKKNMPRLYERLHAAKKYLFRQGRTEYKVSREILRRFIRCGLRRAASWREVLPMQTLQRITIPGIACNSLDDLLADLDARGLDYSRSVDSVYLPPATLSVPPFDALGRYYPLNVGLKILTAPEEAAKDGGLPEHSPGTSKKHLSRTDELILVANLMLESDLGPRVYDWVQLQCGGAVWTAFVVAHIDGSAPSEIECQAGLNRIRQLQSNGLLEIALPDGFENAEFRCPACGGEALMDSKGSFHYLKFQNFMLGDYERHLEQTAVRAVSNVHFGEQSLLRRGKFLYQSVPGVRLPAKRNIGDRIAVIEQLMESAGLAVSGRLVLDIGCNAGMMMAEYLKRGARWCHGWDTEAMTPHTEALLLALGCTRFSTTGALMELTRPLEEDLPSFAQSLLPGCVVSYLAIRRHVGWLHSLSSVPWSFLIYEGHQYEDRDHLAEYVNHLREIVDVEVLNVGSYKEGFSNERVVAILANSSAPPISGS